ncbi:enoyl-CoA hydratase [Mycobacterium sp. Root135]|uniref:enoyl-CoA hydratase/isomerase family protein n=1 Tax=Mycobacterium sp. Root135 TaxID=1736457 RepID=UPI0006F429AC|nr:enoyl-CoA hydratase/isomerase family protein [Mycobacterium sp. Root135]KQY06933.1 enoyl-CoA hydratase [Mycobacterium sp. Root135]
MSSFDVARYDLPAEIKVEADGPIRLVTLNRPADLNGANRAMHQGLARLWPLLGEDDGARVVILTGSGKAFCAGGDFDYMQENLDDEVLRTETMREGQSIIEGMLGCPLPIIAAVNGPAVGLGCSLAVLSDIVLIAEDAFLADPHLRMGLVPGDGGMAWPMLTGLSRAKEHLFLGSRISAEAAVGMGLASRTVPTGSLSDEAYALAARLAQIPAAALQSTKLALNSYLSQQLDHAFTTALSGELASMHSAEHRAAVTAVRSKAAANTR